MRVKENLRISCMFILLNVGILNTSSAFCQQISYSRNIENVSNIKFDLAGNKKEELTTSAPTKMTEYPKDDNSPKPYIDEKKENHYKAIRKNLKTLEIIYQTLNAIDAAQTIGCMQKVGCQEKNPLFGSHPSIGKIIAIKSLVGLLHYSAYKHGIKRDDRLKYTLSMEIISIAVQGTVIGLNFRAIM